MTVSNEVDSLIRGAYRDALESSLVNPDEGSRLIVYDPADATLQSCYRTSRLVKRLDARRAKKTSAIAAGAPAPPTVVCPEFDPAKFNFSKINPREVLFERQLASQNYQVVTQKFPQTTGHLLLVASSARAQVMTRDDLMAINDLRRLSSFNVVFNSWSAGSSVNHFHAHLTEEQLPLLSYKVNPVDGTRCFMASEYPATHLAFASDDVDGVWSFVRSLQEHNQPHNVVCSSKYTYVFPRHIDPECRGKNTPYGEICGGFEISGWFTLYDHDAYDRFSANDMMNILKSVTLVPAEPSFARIIASGVTYEPQNVIPNAVCEVEVTVGM